MDASRILSLVMVGLLLAGCNNAGQRELVERELRLQEDRIYKLQDYIHQYQDLLESCRRENEALKRELGITGSTASPPGSTFSPGTSSPGTTSTRPSVDMPFTPPSIELGTPTDPGSTFVPEILPSPDEDLTGTSRGPVKELVINKLLTGGMNNDRFEGDEGLMVVVEPRDAEGKLVRTPGDVSLMVVDPAKSGPAARVARWDFTNEEATALFRKTPLGRGLHFELPWPNQPPDVERLRLYVRVVTPKGEKLLAESDIGVATGATPIENAAPLLLQPAAHATPLSKRWNERKDVPHTAAAPTEAEPTLAQPASVSEEARSNAVAQAQGASEPKAATNKASAKAPAKTVKTVKRPEWKPYR